MSAEVSAAPASAPAAAPAAGGEPASAPSAAPAESAPAAKAESVDRFARVKAAHDKRQGKAAVEPAKPLGEAAKQEAPGEAAKSQLTQQQPPAAAAQAPASLSPDQQKAMQDAIRAEREAYEAKQRSKEMEAKLKAYEEAEGKRKGMNALQRLEADGHTLDQLHEKIVKGEFKAKSAEQLALEAHDEKMRTLEERLAAYERKDQESARSAEREKLAGVIAGQLKEPSYASQFPMLAADPDAGRAIAEMYEANREKFPDATPADIAAHIEQQRSATVKTAAKSKAVLQALVSDPDVKAQLLELLGSKSEQQAQQVTQGANVGNGPDAIPSTRAAEGSRVAPPTRGGSAGRQAAVLAAVEKRRLASMG